MHKIVVPRKGSTGQHYRCDLDGVCDRHFEFSSFPAS